MVDFIQLVEEFLEKYSGITTVVGIVLATVIGLIAIIIAKKQLSLSKQTAKATTESAESLSQIQGSVQLQDAAKDLLESRGQRAKEFLIGIAESVNSNQWTNLKSIYDAPRHASLRNTQRVLSFGSLAYSAACNLGDYEDCSDLYNTISYIRCVNMDQINRGQGNAMIVEFDPLFHEILRNYIETGTVDYPQIDWVRMLELYKRIIDNRL